MDKPDNVCQNPDTVIDQLDVNEDAKIIMREMIAELYEEQTGGKMKHNGGKTKNKMIKFKKLRFSNSRQRRKKTSKKYKKGGSECKTTAKYAFIISIILASFIGVYNCASIASENTNFKDVIEFITRDFKKSIINLFNIADNMTSIQNGKLTTFQAILESFGKLNLFNTGLEKMTAYYNRLKKVESIPEALPQPLLNLLNILCELLYGTKTKDVEQTKDQIKQILNVDDRGKQIQKSLSLPQSTSGITDFSNVSLIKEGNTIFVANVKPDKIVKIDVNVVDDVESMEL